MSYTYNELSALNRNKLYKGLKNIFFFFYPNRAQKCPKLSFIDANVYLKEISYLLKVKNLCNTKTLKNIEKLVLAIMISPIWV